MRITTLLLSCSLLSPLAAQNVFDTGLTMGGGLLPVIYGQPRQASRSACRASRSARHRGSRR